jgi:hypothetical protein
MKTSRTCRGNARTHDRLEEVFDSEHPAPISTEGGEAVTKAMEASVRPATRWMRVVSMASARDVTGRMVVSRSAVIAVKIPRQLDRHNFTFRLIA